MPAVGNQEQPVEGREVIGEARDVADAEAFPAVLAQGSREHQRGGDPRQPGDADLGKRGGQQKSCESGREVTAAQDWTGPVVSHPPQLADNASKGKAQERTRNCRSSKGRFASILMCVVLEDHKAY